MLRVSCFSVYSTWQTLIIAFIFLSFCANPNLYGTCLCFPKVFRCEIIFSKKTCKYIAYKISNFRFVMPKVIIFKQFHKYFLKLFSYVHHLVFGFQSVNDKINCSKRVWKMCVEALKGELMSFVSPGGPIKHQ